MLPVSNLISSIIGGLIVAGIMFFLKKIKKRYKNSNYDLLKNEINGDIYFLVNQELRKENIFNASGESLKSFVWLLILLIYKFVEVQNIGKQINIPYLSTRIAFIETNLLSIIFMFLLGFILQDFLSSTRNLISLLSINMFNIEKKLLKLKNKYKNKMTDKEIKLLNEISELVEQRSFYITDIKFENALKNFIYLISYENKEESKKEVAVTQEEQE